MSESETIEESYQASVNRLLLRVEELEQEIARLKRGEGVIICDCHAWPDVPEMHGYVVALEQQNAALKDQRRHDPQPTYVELENEVMLLERRLALARKALERTLPHIEYEGSVRQQIVDTLAHLDAPAEVKK